MVAAGHWRFALQPARLFSIAAKFPRRYEDIGGESVRRMDQPSEPEFGESSDNELLQRFSLDALEKPLHVDNRATCVPRLTTSAWSRASIANVIMFFSTAVTSAVATTVAPTGVGRQMMEFEAVADRGFSLIQMRLNRAGGRVFHEPQQKRRREYRWPAGINRAQQFLGDDAMLDFGFQTWLKRCFHMCFCQGIIELAAINPAFRHLAAAR